MKTRNLVVWGIVAISVVSCSSYFIKKFMKDNNNSKEKIAEQIHRLELPEGWDLNRVSEELARGFQREYDADDLLHLKWKLEEEKKIVAG